MVPDVQNDDALDRDKAEAKAIEALKTLDVGATTSIHLNGLESIKVSRVATYVWRTDITEQAMTHPALYRCGDTYLLEQYSFADDPERTLLWKFED